MKKLGTEGSCLLVSRGRNFTETAAQTVEAICDLESVCLVGF